MMDVDGIDIEDEEAVDNASSSLVMNNSNIAEEELFNIEQWPGRSSKTYEKIGPCSKFKLLRI